MYSPGERVNWVYADDWDVDPGGTVLKWSPEYYRVTVQWDDDGNTTEEHPDDLEAI